MKKFLLKKVLLLSLLTGGLCSATFAQNDADPAITSFSFAASPVQENSTTTLTVYVTNGGFTTSLTTGSFGLKISLPTTVVNPPASFGPEYKAFPENASNPTGTFANRFNWTYDATTRNFLGTSNQPIAAGDGGTVTITVKGYVPVTAPVNSIANIVRLNPGQYPNEDNNNNNLTAALAVAPGGVVSVGLLDFNATGKDNKTVSLDWQTTSELNSKYFDVEFSTDGVKFSTIGTVTAAGTSTTARSYNLIHAKPINGINYYRLKQVDMDGSAKYSVIRKVKFGSSTLIYAMPNPTHDRVTIISGNGGKVESVGIYTADGRKMQQINNYTYGSSIDMSRFAPATYLIRITDKDGATEILKVIKN